MLNFKSTHTKLKGLSDAELIFAYKAKGDKKCLEVFYDRYAYLVYGVCMKYLKRTEDAEDLTLMIFTALGEKIKKHEIQFFKSWLHVLVRNECLMKLRKNSFNNIAFEDTLLDSEMLNETDSISEKEILELSINDLNACINKLQIHQKNCIQKFYLDKKSYQEISFEENMTLNEVKSHLQNGKRNLKILMTNPNKNAQ
jgi:RNA polymerase sigma-70 factor (ECF subfamily)